MGILVQHSPSRETSLRRPQNLPLESDVQQLRTYVMSRICEMIDNDYLIWTAAEFNELRSLLVCRITLFNSRRGEPARLLLREWQDAESNVWISDEMVERIYDPLEKVLLGKYHLAYQRGKGSRKMVPILIPVDVVDALKLLVEVRPQCSTEIENPYLFATTKSKDGHADGWQSVRNSCVKTGIIQPDRLTATRMRHRASTYYALLDVSEKERNAFYSRMGHSEAINESVYQCPPSVLEVTKVGRYLQDLDTGNIAATRAGLVIRYYLDCLWMGSLELIRL